jgi:hypothetical protein
MRRIVLTVLLASSLLFIHNVNRVQETLCHRLDHVHVVLVELVKKPTQTKMDVFHVNQVTTQMETDHANLVQLVHSHLELAQPRVAHVFVVMKTSKTKQDVHRVQQERFHLMEVSAKPAHWA